MKIFLFSVAVMLVATVSVSCENNQNDNQQQVDEKSIYENPIDSLVDYMEEVRTTEDYIHFSRNPDVIYEYLTTHPDFLKNSDSNGYTSSQYLLWRDCGDIRVYTIPYSTNRGVVYRNFIQFKDDGRVDTSFLYEEDNLGGMYKIAQIKDNKGKTHYLLFTQYLYNHCGRYYEERVRAFSIENGCLVRDGLFHEKGKIYDELDANCGSAAVDIPLDFDCVCLLCYENGEYTKDSVMLIISDVDGIWPTCSGSKYLWNGEYFKYVGGCTYCANGDYDPWRQ